MAGFLCDPQSTPATAVRRYATSTEEEARHAVARPSAWTVQAPDEKIAMANWKSSQDCPRHNASKVGERCDIICPDLPKVLWARKSLVGEVE
jgi:hypothetical protein